MSGRKVSATGFLVIVPEFNYSKTEVVKARIVRMRTSKPSLARGEIAVKVKLNFDADSLRDSIPEIEVDVNGFMTPITEILAGMKDD
jgi:hypothetical protein